MAIFATILLHTVIYVSAALLIVACALAVMYIATEIAWPQDRIDASPKNNEEDKKKAVREEKEREARQSFFDDERYISGFDHDGRLIRRGNKVPREKAFDYYETFRKLDDTITMKTFDEPI